MKNNIAIIPARAGSKGLKDKNIKELLGKPLMAYTIEAALKSGCFRKVMVSTDSVVYAEIAERYGAEVPFLRSAENSSDTIGSWDVVREVLRNYQEKFDHVALLQPTSPLRTEQHIKEAFSHLDVDQNRNVISVTEVSHPVQWCFELQENLSMQKFSQNPFCYFRRQDLPPHFHENGAIYLVKAEKIKQTDYNIYADHCFAYVMSKRDSVDIDDIIDFETVKAIMELRINRK